MSEKGLKTIDFEALLKTSVSLPLVRIDREEFLKSELKKYCDKKTIRKAISVNPAYAGIAQSVINTIADDCIRYESVKVSAISFASGIPGGVAMVASIPADIAQYYAHVLRIIQKLAYLYGWQSLIDEEGTVDTKTSQILTLFTGVMFGVNSAKTVVTKLSGSMAQRVEKVLINKALTKGVIYPVVKKVATILGVKMTKEVFAKGVSKIIPVVGGFVSGGLTYVTYRPMSIKFKNYLEGLDLASVEHYEELKKKQDTNGEDYIEVNYTDVDATDNEQIE